MAIKFGGNASGYQINTASFDTKTFDCGTDYRLFINRIDKVCKISSQLNDGICAMKENVETIKTFAGGDCIQRINLTMSEVPYNPIMEAVHPCIEIDNIVETDALLMASTGDCDPGIKAFEVTIAFSGYGEGGAFLDDPSGAAALVGGFSGIDTQLIEKINAISFQIVQDYGYDAPIDDFHTFNLTLRGVIKAEADDRIDVKECTAASKFYQTRLTISIDTVNGVIKQDREVTFQGEYANSGDAKSGFSTQCN